MNKLNQKAGFLFLLAMVPLFVAGCGNAGDRKTAAVVPPGSTKVSFVSRHEDSPESDVLVGGLIIYATSSSSSSASEAFYFSSESGASAGATLPNDTYTFYALGYSGAMDGSVTVVRCGTNGSAVTLTGSAVTVPITMSAASCSNSAFTDGATTYSSSFGVTQLQLFKCYSASYTGTMTNGMGTTPCTPNSGSPIGSMKLTLNAYTSLTGTATWSAAITSSCYTTSSSNFPVSLPPRVPQSANNTFLAMTVMAYSDSACTSLVDTYNFTQGPENSASGTATGNSAYNVGSTGLLLLRDF